MGKTVLVGEYVYTDAYVRLSFLCRLEFQQPVITLFKCKAIKMLPSPAHARARAQDAYENTSVHENACTSAHTLAHLFEYAHSYRHAASPPPRIKTVYSYPIKFIITIYR